MLKQHRIGWLVAVAFIAWVATAARAQQAYYVVPLKDLNTADAKIPEPDKAGKGWSDWRHPVLLEPSIRIDSPEAQAYLTFEGYNGPTGGGSWGYWYSQNGIAQTSVVLRGPAGTDLSGEVFVPKSDGSGLVPIKFTVPASSADAKAKATFFAGKQKYYEALLARRIPGAAWFRYQAREAAAQAGDNKAADANTPNRNRPASEDEQTYGLFSGGRAVSENLQLDRALWPRSGGDRSVPIETLKGITVEAMDWKPLIANVHPEVDKLATIIPDDQHGIFFPSFDSAMKAFDEADQRGTPVFEQFESSSQDAGVRERYRRQLCLPETQMARLLGPQVISAMAITGSDPYLRTGSDVAVLFEPTGKVNLQALLASSMAQAAQSEEDGAGIDGKPERVNGQVGEIAYIGFVSPGRRISAYLATIDGAGVVTNSLAQLRRLAEVSAGKANRLSAAPEYIFFRNRYPRSDSDETGFAILPDAAIRRWCSPKWRIADSRRTRAAAVMADFQAAHVDQILMTTRPVVVKPALAASTQTDGNDLTLTAAGVSSAVYGTLDFMTPIAELQIDKVTEAEASMYGRWRDSYQVDWSSYFDPIGARLSIRPGGTSVDLSVMPLISGSSYHQFMDLSVGAKIAQNTGDRHPDLFHIAMAINRESKAMQQGAGMVAGIGGADLNPIGWLGPTVAIYVDDDPIWAKLAAAENQDQFLESHLSDLPVVIYLQSSNPLKLTAFLIAMHGFADQSAPGQTVWTPVKYGEMSYTNITPSVQAKAGNQNMGNLSICYAAVGGALLISPNEDALKRAMDRQTARAAASTQPAATQPEGALAAARQQPPAAAPWIGENLCAQIDVAAVQKSLMGFLDTNYEQTTQERAWANLPILNEWHRRFPGVDPVVAQQTLFQTRLLDPAGGRYTWNARLQTMESTNYGCPESPKKGPVWPTGLMGIDKANFGITFDNGGMRAKAELKWLPAK